MVIAPLRTHVSACPVGRGIRVPSMTATKCASLTEAAPLNPFSANAMMVGMAATALFPTVTIPYPVIMEFAKDPTGVTALRAGQVRTARN